MEKEEEIDKSRKGKEIGEDVESDKEMRKKK